MHAHASDSRDCLNHDAHDQGSAWDGGCIHIHLQSARAGRALNLRESELSYGGPGLKTASSNIVVIFLYYNVSYCIIMLHDYMVLYYISMHGKGED